MHCACVAYVLRMWRSHCASCDMRSRIRDANGVSAAYRVRICGVKCDGMTYTRRKRCAFTTGLVIVHLLLLSGAQLGYIGVIQGIYYGSLAMSLIDPFLDRHIYNLTHFIKFLLKTDHLYTTPNVSQWSWRFVQV